MTRTKGKNRTKTKRLNVAHIVPWTPHQCGMYETARELVAAERALGINAHIVDPRPSKQEIEAMFAKADADKITKPCPACKQAVPASAILKKQQRPRADHWAEDRGVNNAPIEFAVNSDVLISHSGIDRKELKDFKGPIYHVMHGRPLSSFLIEHSGETPIYSIYKQMMKDSRFKGFITLWPEFLEHWQVLVGDRVQAFDSFVDLDFWKPQENSAYDWNGLGGEINVVISDRWRHDKTPYHQINAFAKFADKHPNAKLHVYGCTENGRGLNTLFGVLKERGVMGEILPNVRGLWNIYPKADMVLTPHTMAVRTVREALACGCQVVSPTGNRFTEYTSEEENLSGFSEAMEKAYQDKQADPVATVKKNRSMAETSFDVNKTAEQFVRLFQKATQ